MKNCCNVRNFGHRDTFYLLSSLLGILGLCSSYSKADILSRFRDEYLQAAKKLGDQYTHVRVTTTEQTWDTKGNFLWTYRVEYLRDGNSYCRKKTIIASAQPTLPIGFVRAEGGNAEKYFAISQRMNSDTFAIENFGSVNPEDFWSRARNQCPPLFASTCGDGSQISELISSPNVCLISAVERILDDSDVVDITVDEPGPDGGLRPEYHLYFYPGNWSFAGWSRPLVGPKWKKGDRFETLELRVAYAASDPSQLRSVHRWIMSPWLPHVLKSQQIDDIDSITFGNIPRDKFTLAFFGVQEPARHSTTSRILWALAINAAFFAILGAFFLIRASRRNHKQSDKNAVSG